MDGGPQRPPHVEHVARVPRPQAVRPPGRRRRRQRGDEAADAAQLCGGHVGEVLAAQDLLGRPGDEHRRRLVLGRAVVVPARRRRRAPAAAPRPAGRGRPAGRAWSLGARSQNVVLLAAPAVVSAGAPLVPAPGRGLSGAGDHRLLRPEHRRRRSFQPGHDRGLHGQPDHVRRRVLPKPVLGGGHGGPGALPRGRRGGIRSTGIGCYFDDPVHEVFGITSREWQSFYHFTVGGPVEDVRLTTLPAYDFEESDERTNVPVATLLPRHFASPAKAGKCYLKVPIQVIAQLREPLAQHFVPPGSTAGALTLPRLDRPLSDVDNDELRPSDGRNSDLDDEAPLIDVILRHRRAVALDEKRLVFRAPRGARC